MYIVTNERRMERSWRFHAQLEARLYTWRGATLRGVLKALSPFNQTSWQERWCPGVILGPSNAQLRVFECLMWDYFIILRQLNAEPCPAWTTERGKLNEAGHLVTH